MFHRLAASIGVLIVFGSALPPVALASRSGNLGQAADRGDGSPLTIYVARRPGLFVKLWVGPRSIVGIRASSIVRCEDGSKERGSVTSAEGAGFVVHRNGWFRHQELEGYEGSGFYFMALSGRVRRNRVTGEYRAWEERMGEEDEGWLPRCGTLTPQGLSMYFVARRVSGPPWRAG